MKRLFYLLSFVAACCACEKDDTATMDVADLHGSYWIEKHCYTTCYENGEYVTKDAHATGSIGGCAYFLHFSDADRMTEYVSSDAPFSYYRVYSFGYYPQWRQFEIDDVFYEATGFSAGRISWRYKSIDSSEQMIEIERVFEPWEPSPEWLRRLAACPNSEEIDGPQYR